eukprot:TRINITY_DN4119_c0_g2_i1.p1 TRINITY_DN4119_c0_g2~~TRINITY_DN4119_c0_g2_i1.p1  ORF type:complete len:560 (-),score=62.74 TRINITY_DN4119_c0_g2_i1:206-1885(-)
MASYGINEATKVDGKKADEFGLSENDPLLNKCDNSNDSEASPNDWLDIRKLCSAFGYQLVALLFVHQHLQKGFLSAWTGAGIPYIFKEYAVPAGRVQVLNGVSRLPWAMKPIVGMASDMFPVLGYNRVPYIVATCAVGIAACAAVGFSTTMTLPLAVLVICFFCTELQYSTCDLLSEAKYAEHIQKHPSQGSALLSYVWFGLGVGGLIATLMSGFVIDTYGPRSMFSSGCIMMLPLFVPIVCGFWQEKKKSDEEVAQERKNALKHPETIFLCGVMALATLTMTYTGVFIENVWITFTVSLTVAIIVLASFSIVLSPLIARVNAFALINSACCMSIGGASFYFFTDTPKEYPEGPHFDPYFFNTVLGVAGSVISLLGILFYQRFMSHWKYRSMIMFTNIMIFFLYLSDAVLYSRLNLKLGIPDKAFVLTTGALETIVAQWQWMPSVLVFSYLCPKGSEATMYALLAGCSNLGSVIASNNGALLLHLLGCHPRGAPMESAQFKNLWLASLIGTVFPFLTTLFTVRLFPNCRQNEQILEGGATTDPTAGSLWKRWRGQMSEN